MSFISFRPKSVPFLNLTGKVNNGDAACRAALVEVHEEEHDQEQ